MGHFDGPVLSLDGSRDQVDGAVGSMAISVAEFIDQLQMVKQQKRGEKLITPVKSDTRCLSKDGCTPTKRRMLDVGA